MEEWCQRFGWGHQDVNIHRGNQTRWLTVRQKQVNSDIHSVWLIILTGDQIYTHLSWGICSFWLADPQEYGFMGKSAHQRTGTHKHLRLFWTGSLTVALQTHLSGVSECRSDRDLHLHQRMPPSALESGSPEDRETDKCVQKDSGDTLPVIGWKLCPGESHLLIMLQVREGHSPQTAPLWTTKTQQQAPPTHTCNHGDTDRRSYLTLDKPRFPWLSRAQREVCWLWCSLWNQTSVLCGLWSYLQWYVHCHHIKSMIPLHQEGMKWDGTKASCCFLLPPTLTSPQTCRTAAGLWTRCTHLKV